MQEKNMKIEMRVKAKTKRKIDECKKKNVIEKTRGPN